MVSSSGWLLGWKATAVDVWRYRPPSSDRNLRRHWASCAPTPLKRAAVWRRTRRALRSADAVLAHAALILVSSPSVLRAGFRGFRWAHFARRRDEGCCCFRSWDLGTRRHTPSERLRCEARVGSGCHPSPWLRSLSGPGGTASRSSMAMRGRLKPVIIGQKSKRSLSRAFLCGAMRTTKVTQPRYRAMELIILTGERNDQEPSQ